MKQIRDIAVSGVDTFKKAEKVCEIVGSEFNVASKSKWFFDNNDELDFMYTWKKQEEHYNFKNCTQMTYEEFLDEYDAESRVVWLSDEPPLLNERDTRENVQICDNPDVMSAEKRKMETDSEDPLNSDAHDYIEMEDEVIGMPVEFDEIKGFDNSLSITADDGTVYAYEKPDFECELLKNVGKWHIGYFIHDGTVLSAKWSIDGGVLSRMHDADIWYNLTPIEPKWWEDKELKAELIKEFAHTINCNNIDTFLNDFDYKIAERMVQSLYYQDK